MLEDRTQLGRIKRRVQNHPVAALTLFGGVVVIGLGQVLDCRDDAPVTAGGSLPGLGCPVQLEAVQGSFGLPLLST